LSLHLDCAGSPNLDGTLAKLISRLATRASKEPQTSSSDEGKDEAQTPGTEPDARFTLANERTFLAWSRTSLALIAAGLAVAQLLPPFPRVPWGRSVIATPLILLGAALSGLSYVEWRRNQRAIRLGEPLPHTQLPRILALTIGVIALLAAAVDLYSKSTGH
jgi:putative membrane protein